MQFSTLSSLSATQYDAIANHNVPADQQRYLQSGFTPPSWTILPGTTPLLPGLTFGITSAPITLIPGAPSIPPAPTLGQWIQYVALANFGLDTTKLPGTDSGNKACANTIARLLRLTDASYWPSANYFNVADETVAFEKAGWFTTTDVSKVQVGDIAVENGVPDQYLNTGMQSSSNPVSLHTEGDNTYENHIGVVISYHGQLAILSNSSTPGKFQLITDLEYNGLGTPFDPAHGGGPTGLGEATRNLGPTRFYRPPGANPTLNYQNGTLVTNFYSAK